jgi:hypothetical protein
MKAVDSLQELSVRDGVDEDGRSLLGRHVGREHGRSTG